MKGETGRVERPTFNPREEFGRAVIGLGKERDRCMVLAALHSVPHDGNVVHT